MYNFGQRSGETKSFQFDFINRSSKHQPVFLNDRSFENTARYLGIKQDAKLRWKPHIKKSKKN